jgi:2-phosphosulfolactate phosphatase
MAMPLDVFLLPALVEPQQLAGRTAVVIDVLRATTTIIQALASGAREVLVCQDIDQARAVAAKLGTDAILGGERAGLPIEGFQLGNSPAEFTPAAVGGKTLIFTTTNGTRAMAACARARQVWLAAFVNFSAICRELAADAVRPSCEGITLVCAGTDGEVTREDTLLAGAIVDDLAGNPDVRLVLNDQAEIAADAWRACCRDLGENDPLGRALRASRGGRNLLEIGMENDIAIAAEIDKFDLAPALDTKSWRVRVA